MDVRSNGDHSIHRSPSSLLIPLLRDSYLYRLRLGLNGAPNNASDQEEIAPFILGRDRSIPFFMFHAQQSRDPRIFFPGA